jgi:CheY-like chemotaxis protein
MGAMRAQVLIVEDEADTIEELRQVFAELPGAAELTIATNRDSALTLLESMFFDLVVLDLKIPTIDGALDANPEYGHAVFARANSVAPGTPIFVLTGSQAEDFIPAMLQQQQQVDIWGEGRQIGNIVFLKKLKFDECPVKLRPILTAVGALSDVELDRGHVSLTLSEERLIRIFAKKYGGARCAISLLGGGLSGAKVVRLHITNTDGASIHHAVAKLGSPGDIRDEARRFDKQVSRLDPKATPRKLGTHEFGGGAVAGVFYGLAGGYDASAFDIATHQNGRATIVVKYIEATMAPWNNGVPQSRRSIAEVRRRVLSDKDLAMLRKAYDLKWTNMFEQNDIQTRWACIHGDLHGSNVLVSEDNSMVLIDYGDVAEGPVSLDPITLELSLLFHPQGISLIKWPSLEQAASWGDFDIYLVGSPVSEFVSECRAWAHRVAAGKREIAATAYSYLVRQLKYEDTNKPLALALLDGVKRYYETT